MKTKIECFGKCEVEKVLLKERRSLSKKLLLHVFSELKERHTSKAIKESQVLINGRVNSLLTKQVMEKLKEIDCLIEESIEEISDTIKIKYIAKNAE